MKHFSYYITPGSRRIAATSDDPNVRVSAYLTEDNMRQVAVFINRSTSTARTVDFDAGTFPFDSSNVYQTAGTMNFQSLGAVGSQLMLPAQSLTTVVLDRSLSTESPLLSISGIPPNLTLFWPLASAGFTVQSRTNLVLGDWTSVSSPAPQIVGAQWQVTLPASASTPATFYRLVK
jgi:hypothetical protein